MASRAVIPTMGKIQKLLSRVYFDSLITREFPNIPEFLSTLTTDNAISVIHQWVKDPRFGYNRNQVTIPFDLRTEIPGYDLLPIGFQFTISITLVQDIYQSEYVKYEDALDFNMGIYTKTSLKNIEPDKDYSFVASYIDTTDEITVNSHQDTWTISGSFQKISEGISKIFFQSAFSLLLQPGYVENPVFYFTISWSIRPISHVVSSKFYKAIVPKSTSVDSFDFLDDFNPQGSFEIL
jgi:hypothetical protein